MATARQTDSPEHWRHNTQMDRDVRRHEVRNAPPAGHEVSSLRLPKQASAGHDMSSLGLPKHAPAGHEVALGLPKHAPDGPEMSSLGLPKQAPAGHDVALGLPTQAPAGHEVSLGLPKQAAAGHEVSLGLPKNASLGHDVSLGLPKQATAGHEVSLGLPMQAPLGQHEVSLGLPKQAPLGHEVSLGLPKQAPLRHEVSPGLPKQAALGHEVSLGLPKHAPLGREVSMGLPKQAPLTWLPKQTPLEHKAPLTWLPKQAPPERRAIPELKAIPEHRAIPELKAIPEHSAIPELKTIPEHSAIPELKPPLALPKQTPREVRTPHLRSSSLSVILLTMTLTGVLFLAGLQPAGHRTLHHSPRSWLAKPCALHRCPPGPAAGGWRLQLPPSWTLRSLCLLAGLVLAFRLIAGQRLPSRPDANCRSLTTESRSASLDALGVPTLVVDAATANIVSANHCAQRTLCEGQSLVGHALSSYFPSTSLEQLCVSPSCYAKCATGADTCVDTVVYATRIADIVTVVFQEVATTVSLDLELQIQRKVVAQLAHEVRNKTTAAFSMLERIQNVAADNTLDARRELTAIDADITRCIAQLAEADQLIETRLAFHSIYTGTYKTVVQTIDLAATMHTLCRTAAALAPKSARFRVDCPPNLSATFDVYVFKHVATNYLNNARAAVEQGEIVFTLVAYGDGALTFSVRDDGPGVPATIVDTLFQEDVVNGNSRGIGLGLLSCAKFAETIGGQCWLEATRRRDNELKLAGFSDFRFRIPGLLVGRQAPQLVDPLAVLPRQLSVFIVDDSGLIRKSIRHKFSKIMARLNATFDFFEFATCEAVPIDKLVLTGSNALITVDQNLDGAGGKLTGADLIRTLVRHHFQGVVVSASGDPDFAHIHRLLGAHCVFGKPLPNHDCLLQALIVTYRDRQCYQDVTSVPTNGAV